MALFHFQADDHGLGLAVWLLVILPKMKNSLSDLVFSSIKLQ